MNSQNRHVSFKFSVLNLMYIILSSISDTHKVAQEHTFKLFKIKTSNFFKWKKKKGLILSGTQIQLNNHYMNDARRWQTFREIYVTSQNKIEQ